MGQGFKILLSKIPLIDGISNSFYELSVFTLNQILLKKCVYFSANLETSS